MRFAATGHRPERFATSDIPWVQAQIRAVVSGLAAERDDVVALSGMQRGVDLWFAVEAWRAGVPVEAYLPWYGWELKWEEGWQAAHDLIMEQSREIHPIASGYRAGIFHTRNERMIDSADAGLVVFDGRPTGGTYHALGLLQSQGKPYVLIDTGARKVVPVGTLPSPVLADG